MVDQSAEPHVKLALSLRAVPGGYAVLFGAGASVSAGMLSAWGVQCDLIRQIASAEGAEIPDGDDGPYDWYVERFKREPAYDTLLADLSETTSGRQALLRSYFEPDETEREQGIKQPADGHRALARPVVTTVGQFCQVGIEAVRGVQGQGGGGGVVPLISKQITDAFQAPQVTSPTACHGRLGLAQQRDPRTGSLRALTGGQGDHVDLLLRPGSLVGDLGGTDPGPGSPPGNRVWA